MKSSFTRGELTVAGNFPMTISTLNCSENIERYRKIIQQRIVAVKEEANRKYANLVESIPIRLEQIIEKAEDKVADADIIEE
jgi:hypothetical protein